MFFRDEKGDLLLEKDGKYFPAVYQNGSFRVSDEPVENPTVIGTLTVDMAKQMFGTEPADTVETATRRSRKKAEA